MDKVFVGNLAYSVTAEALKSLFVEVGEVAEVALISRYGRSKGFAFVSFVDASKNAAAVERFNGTDLEGRALNCEIARPKPPKKERVPKDEDTHEEEGDVKKERRERPRKPKQKKDDGADVEAKEVVQKEPRKKPVKEVKEHTETADNAAERPKRERKPRERKPRDESVISETVLFVGNLPFEVATEDLQTMFAKYELTSVRLVMDSYGRSKGFAFVDVGSHEHQQMAIADFVDAVVNERKLIIKPAFAQQTPAVQE